MMAAPGDQHTRGRGLVPGWWPHRGLLLLGTRAHAVSCLHLEIAHAVPCRLEPPLPRVGCRGLHGALLGSAWPPRAELLSRPHFCPGIPATPSAGFQGLPLSRARTCLLASSLSLHSLSCSLHICKMGLHLREDLASGCPSAHGVREALRVEKQPCKGLAGGVVWACSEVSQALRTAGVQGKREETGARLGVWKTRLNRFKL